MATPTDDDNADDCISGNYYGYERGGTLDIKWEDAEYVNAPILTDCPVNIECSVIESTQPGTHELFIGKVKKVHVDEEYVDDKGNIMWDKMDLM